MAVKETATKIKTYYRNESVEDAYSTCWGEGNIHCGYFGHLDNKMKQKRSFSEAAEDITDRMIEVGNITSDSKVLDLGCGLGKPILDVCQKTGAEGFGLDLSPSNIDKCEANKTERMTQIDGELKCEFVLGSFTEIPEKLKNGSFTHIFSQFAFCHCHRQIQEIFTNALECLAPGGTLIVFDYIGGDLSPTAEIKEHCYDRLHFKYLMGHNKYQEELNKSDLILERYDNLNHHGAHGYGELARLAKEHGFKKVNGEPLSLDYEVTAKACEQNMMGVNLYVAKKKVSNMSEGVIELEC